MLLPIDSLFLKSKILRDSIQNHSTLHIVPKKKHSLIPGLISFSERSMDEATLPHVPLWMSA